MSRNIPRSMFEESIPVIGESIATDMPKEYEEMVNLNTARLNTRKQLVIEMTPMKFSNELLKCDALLDNLEEVKSIINTVPMNEIVDSRINNNTIFERFFKRYNNRSLLFLKLLHMESIYADNYRYEDIRFTFKESIEKLASDFNTNVNTAICKVYLSCLLEKMFTPVEEEIKAKEQDEIVNKTHSKKIEKSQKRKNNTFYYNGK